MGLDDIHKSSYDKLKKQNNDDSGALAVDNCIEIIYDPKRDNAPALKIILRSSYDVLPIPALFLQVAVLEGLYYKTFYRGN